MLKIKSSNINYPNGIFVNKISYECNVTLFVIICISYYNHRFYLFYYSIMEKNRKTLNKAYLHVHLSVVLSNSSIDHQNRSEND